MAALFVWLALFSLGGCQSVPSASEPARGAMQEQRLDVAFFPQKAYQCGPAALASMLDHAGQPASPDSLVDEVWLPKSKGSLVMELAGAARARGLLAYPVSTTTDLLAELDAGHPVLVMQNLLFSWWPQWHFAVVTGYSDHGDQLYLHSGQKQNWRVGQAWLEHTWAQADHVAYVMLPAGTLPAHSKAPTLIEALENTAHASGQADLPTWHAAAVRHNDNALMQFAYGNTLYQAQKHNAAIAAWRQATALAPDYAPAWNNLADGLGQAGCRKQALDAIEHAIALEADNALYQQTRQEIILLASSPESCTAQQ